jgi:hypothetical protein
MAMTGLTGVWIRTGSTFSPCSLASTLLTRSGPFNFHVSFAVRILK